MEKFVPNPKNINIPLGNYGTSRTLLMFQLNRLRKRGKPGISGGCSWFKTNSFIVIQLLIFHVRSR